MKNRKHLWAVVSIIAVVLALVLAGCSGGVELTYRVGGAASEAEVAYTNADGELEEATVSLPWEETLSVGSEFSFEIEAIDESGSGTVTCEALVGDDSLGEGSGNTSVECRGSFSKKGNSLTSSFSSVADPLAREHVETGTDYLDQDQIDEAVGELEEAVRLAPSLAEARLKLGYAYFEQGQLAEAIVELQRAIELDPDNVDAYRNLGTVYGEQGKWEEAAANYEKAVELDPDFGEAYGDLVWPYVELGKLSEAVAAGEKAIKLSPNYANAHNNLGAAYKEQGRLDEAIAEYKEAISINPDDADAYNNLGVAYKAQGRLDEAIAEYKKAIEINPDYAGAHNNLGIAYADQGQSDGAIAEYKKAIEIDPDDAKVHKNLGITYFKQGRFDEAIAEYKEAIRINPDYAGAHKNLGLTYREQGRMEEAIAAFETYLQILPDAPDREAVEQEIVKLRRQAAGTEHANAAGGYSLRYPEGWYVVENGTETSLAPSREDYEASSLRSPLVTLISWPLAQATESFGLEEDAAPEEFLQVIAGRLEAEISEIESVEIAGYPAAVAATSGTLQGTTYEGDLIIILVEERLFFAEGLAPPDQWADFRPTFVDMVNSLSFFEPEG